MKAQARASSVDLVTLDRHGYSVHRWGSGWTLLDPDGAALMIGDHGCVAPRKVDAVAEGLARIKANGVV